LGFLGTALGEENGEATEVAPAGVAIVAIVAVVVVVVVVDSEGRVEAPEEDVREGKVR
jgi:hypothetical protein